MGGGNGGDVDDVASVAVGVDPGAQQGGFAIPAIHPQADPGFGAHVLVQGLPDPLQCLRQGIGAMGGLNDFLAQRQPAVCLGVVFRRHSGQQFLVQRGFGGARGARLVGRGLLALAGQIADAGGCPAGQSQSKPAQTPTHYRHGRHDQGTQGENKGPGKAHDFLVRGYRVTILGKVSPLAWRTQGHTVSNR